MFYLHNQTLEVIFIYIYLGISHLQLVKEKSYSVASRYPLLY